jgi:hypothetical protein
MIVKPTVNGHLIRRLLPLKGFPGTDEIPSIADAEES